MNFSIQELSEKQLELLGLSRKDILDMPPRTYNALMSGNRTSLIRFNNVRVPGLEVGSLDAKLSLERKPDGSVALRFHPINQTAKNTFNLSRDEISKLKDGTNFITKKLLNGREHLVGLDKQTSEFVAVPKDSIEAPKKINGVELTDNQAKDFKDGKDIKIGDQKFHLNLSDELGISAAENSSILSSLQFRHSTYNSTELLFDLALLTSGIGSIVMIGHLADLLVYTSAAAIKGKKQGTIAQLVNENKAVRDVLAKASPEIARKFEKGKFLTPKEIKEMVESYLDRHEEIGVFSGLEFKAGYPTGINASVIDENKSGEVKPGYTGDNQGNHGAIADHSTDEHAGKTETIHEQTKKKVFIKR
jgi:hypothetical protein